MRSPSPRPAGSLRCPGVSAMSTGDPRGRGMRFAERQLRRHGWRRGQGLGKREDGIAEAIRVKLKCDTAGVGHDAAELFSFHWWDHLFNKAAANIAVEDGVSVRAVAGQGVRVSTKKPRRAGSAGGMLYGRFVKSATLTAGGEEPVEQPPGSESSEEEEKLDLSSARRLTDEELVRACGGRTAHKGARHGLTMSAKLARLEEQEKAFLARYPPREQQAEPLESSSPAEMREKKKKKKKRSRNRANPEELQSWEPSGEEAVGEGKVVKRKKKSQEPTGEEDVAGKAAKRKKKKKNKKEDKEEPAETELPPEDTDGPDQAGHSPRKKRKKRKREPE